MRMVGGLPVVVGACAAALALVLTAHPGAAPAEPDEPGRAAVPAQLAGYSHLTGNVSASPPGPAVALFQHGWGVELLDLPQAVVLGAGGDVYRRVDAAEDRAGAETQGDPAPMLISPDGTKVAVGDHDTDEPDVVVVDLLTGGTTTHPLPTGRSVVPVAWSRDGRTLAHLLSAGATSPYSGSRIVGDVGLLDLSDDSTEVLEERTAVGVAFSPDGSELAVERTGVEDPISVVDLRSGTRRAIESEGVLAGPTAWSPDGRLLATTTTRPDIGLPNVDSPGTPTGLSFADATGAGGVDVPPALRLPLSGPGRVLGWAGPDEVVLLLEDGGDDLALSGVPLDGAEPRTLMRLSDLGSYGVGRFQLASDAADGLAVVTPTDVDRGPWPLPVRALLALVVGLAAWLVARAVSRRLPAPPSG
ncbi:hypothetical protein GCM10023339_16030 [Alloalcanivorax gelatiniphagus]